MDNGEVKFPSQSPAAQLRQALTTYLRERLPFQCGVHQEQIRGILDVSGEITQPSGIYVSSIDLGGHRGIPGRILVDVELAATAWSHLNEDPSGIECDMLASGIQQALGEGDFAPALDGWIIRGIDSWQSGEPQMQEQFRQCTVKTTIYLQNSNF